MSNNQEEALATVITANDLGSAAQEGVQRALACRKQAVELSAKEIEHVSGAMMPVMSAIFDPIRDPIIALPRPPITIGLISPIPMPRVPLETM